MGNNNDYTTINIVLYSPPLKTVSYHFTNTKKRKKETHAGSGILSDIIFEKEQRMQEKEQISAQQSELLVNSHILNIEDSPALDEEYNDYETDIKPNIHPLFESNSPPPKGFKKLKRSINEKIFDYSEIKQAEIEEKINELVNADGYYSEVLPIDVENNDEIDNASVEKSFKDNTLVKVLVAVGLAGAWVTLAMFLF